MNGHCQGTLVTVGRKRKSSTESEADGAVWLWASALCECVCPFFCVSERICYSLHVSIWEFAVMHTSYCTCNWSVMQLSVFHMQCVQAARATKWFKWSDETFFTSPSAVFRGNSLFSCLITETYFRKAQRLTPDFKCWESLLLSDFDYSVM